MRLSRVLGAQGKCLPASISSTPDVLVFGKSLGGGLVPFAGIVTREEYNILQHRSIGHFTHEKNALCATAGLAEITYIEQYSLVEHAAQLGEYAIQQLNEMKERHPLIGNIAGTGFHLGIDLVKDEKPKKGRLRRRK